MNNIIKFYENVALSNHDVSNLLNGKVNIEVYPNLHNYSSIDELLGPYQACILLFETKPEYGHWVCIFKLNNKTLEFFNPYGGFPDDSLLSIDKSFRKKSYQIEPYLSQLLINSPYLLTYNEFQFQKRNNNIKTCGRHCVTRLILRNLSLYEYKDTLDHLCKKIHTNYDGIVTLFTI